MHDNKKPISELLKLSMAQLKMAQQESENPVNTLTENFIELADLSSQLLKQNKQSKSPLLNQFLVEQLHKKIQACVVAFQFYDRLSQRLEHIMAHIDKAEKILQRKHPEDKDIQSIFQEIKSSYSMEQERKLLEAILQGQSIEQALQQAQSNSQTNNDSIELF
jgi:arginine deiminase